MCYKPAWSSTTQLRWLDYSSSKESLCVCVSGHGSHTQFTQWDVWVTGGVSMESMWESTCPYHLQCSYVMQVMADRYSCSGSKNKRQQQWPNLWYNTACQSNSQWYSTSKSRTVTNNRTEPCSTASSSHFYQHSKMTLSVMLPVVRVYCVTW